MWAFQPIPAARVEVVVTTTVVPSQVLAFLMALNEGRSPWEWWFA